MTKKPKSIPFVAGVADHSGWAIVVTAQGDGTFVDRRRIELVESGLPSMPHHHEGQQLPLDEAVALVGRVRASAERGAHACLAALAADLGPGLVGLALRQCPPLPDTVAERITNYRAMCVADWVMYRQALARAATERGWFVSWYDAKRVFADAASALKREAIDDLLDAVKQRLGPPWQKDHRMAMAAAIAAAHAKGVAPSL